MSLELSIVLATRNRASSLQRLLFGLCAQISPPSFEVIIADNGSSDGTSSVIINAENQLNVRSTRVETRGKSRAINAALRLAKGSLIVFTDDDIQPHPTWLFAYHAAATRYLECDIFGGKIEIHKEEIPLWVLRSYNLLGLLTSAHNHGDTNTTYGYGQYPFGPNMAIRRDLLNGMETPYPEHLGPGTRSPIGDEGAFFQQFSPPGACDRMYVPHAEVLHDVEKGNLDFYSAISRCFLAGRGHGKYVLTAISGVNYLQSSTLDLILARVLSCRSFQEFVCITARYLGYLCGKYDIRIP